MARILLIDDEPALLDALALAVEDEGYEVSTAADGNSGYDRIQSDSPDLVITDVNMPGLDGFSLCRKLREAGSELPVIILTSRDSEIDEALGLELGADDYVAKPFSTRVLLARVRALLRRQALKSGESEDTDEEADLVQGGLRLRPDRLEVRYNEQSVTVTVTEFKLLQVLARRPGVVFTRPQLLDLARGDDSVVAERIIDTYVRRLRRKLEQVDGSFDRIETVVGAGYRWRDD